MRFNGEDKKLKSNKPLSNASGAKLSHIAFIMDGNGRWAKKRLLPRAAGHKEGLKTIEMAVNEGAAMGIPFLSFFAFSTENWKRPKSEVDSLIKLLKTRLPEISKKLAAQGLRLRFCGDFTAFDQELKDILLQAQVLTGYVNDGGFKQDQKGTVNICLNYGGRQEILNAVNKAVSEGKPVSEKDFTGLLYTGGLPDPDLLIRTGGEKRISNFFLYQSAYTELYFSDKLWPDFNKEDFSAAIEDFNKRNRRFGKL